ncbi:GH25 family lysozyme, partial [Asanoa sp. NPDC049573]|uniref:GH25 family lysozyme n=1 Tax=Asanoa sp. NPDC049573 TaxID=3155396 RepID=UPI00342018D3
MGISREPTRGLRLAAALSAAIVVVVMAPGSATASGPFREPSGAAATGEPSVADNGWPGRGAPTHSTGLAAQAIIPPPSGYPINGRDVSSHDHNGGKTVSWPAQKAAGDEFAYVKATEGTTYTNEYFAQDYHGAKSAGLYVGAYHWARPDKGNPVGQANYFVDHMEFSRDGRTLPPFLDIEWPYNDLPDCYGLSQSAMRTWISSFLSQVQARIGVTPMIYTNVNWWNPCTGNSTAFGNYLLDISSCNSSPPSVPGWGNRWTFWQYDIPDCQRGSDRDSNVFNGSLAQLAQLAGGR